MQIFLTENIKTIFYPNKTTCHASQPCPTEKTKEYAKNNILLISFVKKFTST
jgi:hypothetical protein